jgi:hypothetical protein
VPVSKGVLLRTHDVLMPVGRGSVRSVTAGSVFVASRKGVFVLHRFNKVVLMRALVKVLPVLVGLSVLSEHRLQATSGYSRLNRLQRGASLMLNRTLQPHSSELGYLDLPLG